MGKKKTGRKRCTVVDVISLIALASDDRAAYKAMERARPSRDVLRGVYQVLTNADKPVTLVKKYDQCHKLHLFDTAPGRSRPRIGDIRHYSAQQLARGGPFVRLPLDHLGVAKGGMVTAAFDDAIIRVVVKSDEPAPAPAPTPAPTSSS